MRRLALSLGILASLGAVIFLALRTPDTDPAAMRAKYGGSDSRFTEAEHSMAAVHYRPEPLRPG